MNDADQLYLSIGEARALALAGQGLLRPFSTPDEWIVLAMIERLGVLQIDTINVVERSQYLVLWSRLGAYDPTLLDTLLYPKRAVFECMAPVALIAPMSRYGLYRAAMLRHAEPERMWSGQRIWLEENPTALRETLEIVRERGPLASSDFERPAGATRTGPWDWHGPKPSRRALETLWHMGELMVHSRRGGQKVYDLRERVLAEAFDTIPSDNDLPSEEARLRYFARHALDALGVAVPSWLWGYHAVYPSSAPRLSRRVTALRMLEAVVDEGAAVRVVIEGIDEPAFLARSLLPELARLRAGDDARRTTLLSPFDSLIWDRARTRTLFGYDVCFEAYVPAARRRYGYYCLALLHHGKLVGRIDPKMDRASRRLLVRALYLESDTVVDDALLDGLAAALRDLARFLGAESVVVGSDGNEWLGPALAERLRVA